MNDHDELRKNHLHDSDLFRQPDPDEVELAYQLDNLQDANLEAIQRMIYRYTASLYQWVAVLLFYQQSHEPTHNEIFAVVRKVFVEAMQSIDQFHGHASVQNWLFSIALKVARKSKRSKFWDSNGAGQERKVFGISPDESDFRLYRLPGKQQQTVLLRYLFDMELGDIAQILDVQKNEVHKRLVQVRKTLYGDIQTAHRHKRMQAYLDGLLAVQEDETASIEQHLIECSQCQAAILSTREKEEKLAKELKNRWYQDPTDEDTMHMLVRAVEPDMEKPNGGQKIRFTLRQAAWIVGLTATFIGLAILFIRITPVEEEFPAPEPTATQVLPAIIEMQPVIQPNRQNIQTTAEPYIVIQDFTTSGSWNVFASIIFDPTRNVSLLPKIELSEQSMLRAWQGDDG